MKKFIFHITYPIVWAISKLPFFILHLISDFFFLLLFYVIKYRKDVVLENLTFAFPNKNQKELKKIRKAFFRHFVDVFIEMIKSFTISEKEINKRYKYVNLEAIKEVEALNKSIIMIGSHYANWEWVINLGSFTKHQTVGAYTKLSNPYYDKLIRENRSRFGADFVPTSQTIKHILKNKRDNKLCIYGLLSDQSPQISKTHYWSHFLNVKVPIHTGAEMLTKKHDFIPMYMKITKVKRSHYEIRFEIIKQTESETSKYPITDYFLRKTEEQIYEKPEYYLWTHKRFKHRNKTPKNIKS